MPNRYLVVMFLAWLLSRTSEGIAHAIAYAVFLVAGVIWSYEEAARGVNWFRRVLGLAVLILLLLDIVKII